MHGDLWPGIVWRCTQAESLLAWVDRGLNIGQGASAPALECAQQCFFFSRNIGSVTPKSNDFYYIKNLFWIIVSKKIIYLNLKTEARVRSA